MFTKSALQVLLELLKLNDRLVKIKFFEHNP